MPKRWHRPGRWMGTARLLLRTRRARRAGDPGTVDGEVLEMRQQMARLTLDIVGSTLLGIDLQQDADDVRAALESALESFAGGAPALPLRRLGGRRAAASGQATPGTGFAGAACAPGWTRS